MRMVKDFGQEILRAWNSILAKYYFGEAVNAAIKKKFDVAYRDIEKSYRFRPNDFRYVLLRGILAGIKGDDLIGANSCAEAYELLAHSKLADIDREYLRAVSAFWASYYSLESGQITEFESKYQTHAVKFEIGAVSRKWLYFFPARFLNSWVDPAVLDKDAGIFSYSRRRLYPRYIFTGAAFAALLLVITGDYKFAAVGFLAGILWEFFAIRRDVRKYS